MSDDRQGGKRPPGQGTGPGAPPRGRGTKRPDDLQVPLEPMAPSPWDNSLEFNKPKLEPAPVAPPIVVPPRAKAAESGKPAATMAARPRAAAPSPPAQAQPRPAPAPPRAPEPKPATPAAPRSAPPAPQAAPPAAPRPSAPAPRAPAPASAAAPPRAPAPAPAPTPPAAAARPPVSAPSRTSQPIPAASVAPRPVASHAAGPPPPEAPAGRWASNESEEPTFTTGEEIPSIQDMRPPIEPLMDPRRAAPDPPRVVATPADPVALDKPHTFIRGMAILAMLLLFECWAIPLFGADLSLTAPWKLTGQVGGLTFHSGLFFALLVLLTAIPMPYIARAAGLLAVGVTLLAFALGHMRLAVEGFAFRGHPAMTWAFAGKAGVATLLAASLWFPAALYWRSRYTWSFWARMGVLLGAVVVLTNYLVIGFAGGGEKLAVAEALGALGTKHYRSDLVSWVLALLPLALVPLAALAFLPHPRSGAAGLWAWLHVTALAAIPLVQAGFVASFRQGQWKYVLAPLKASLFLYAALLVLPVALGHTVGEVERLIRKRRQRTA